MKVIILAAGQGTRLRPLTDDCPKCMVEVNGKSIIERQLDTMRNCGIKDSDITIVTGYRGDRIVELLAETDISIIENPAYETTNMVCSLMCAEGVLTKSEDVLVSYGDIIYNEGILDKILSSYSDSSVVVDDSWYSYWSERCEDPLDDAETLMFDSEDHLIEIGQKTTELEKVQSQYIGLMRFRGDGVRGILETVQKAKEKSRNGELLWRTDRTYEKMYMTDLLQGMIDEGLKLKVVHIHRGWFEVDDTKDLRIAHNYLDQADAKVFWITGLSGAGKTTIGSLFYEEYRVSYPSTVFLDGDELRKTISSDLGYTETDRRQCAMRYAKLCSMLQEQGVHVIICTISMFDEVREWSRTNTNNYIEVYVRVSMDELKRRDQKGLYSGADSGKKDDVVGIQFEAELPEKPDLVLDNEGEICPAEQVKRIFEFLKN